MRKRYLLLLACVGLLAIYLPGYSRLQYLKTKNEQLESRIRDLESANRALEVEKYRLEHDPEYIERVARDRLGVVKEGEIIFKKIPVTPAPADTPSRTR